MTNERELLERCAKVMGLHVKAHHDDIDDNFMGLVVGAKFTQERLLWSPLTNLADAAAMAIECKVDVKWHMSGVEALQTGKWDLAPCAYELFKDHPTETAAYCYAVCQVVAQIGGE